jgi:hypothetical protein
MTIHLVGRTQRVRFASHLATRVPLWPHAASRCFYYEYFRNRQIAPVRLCRTARASAGASCSYGRTAQRIRRASCASAGMTFRQMPELGGLSDHVISAAGRKARCPELELATNRTASSPSRGAVADHNSISQPGEHHASRRNTPIRSNANAKRSQRRLLEARFPRRRRKLPGNSVGGIAQ